MPPFNYDPSIKDPGSGAYRLLFRSAALLHTADNATRLGLNFANYSITGISTVLVLDGVSDEPIWDKIAASDVGIITSANNDGYSYSDVFVNLDTVPKMHTRRIRQRNRL
jgi:hypothetical protein